ncbi:xylose repressor [Deinococcus malanensis]|uniref:Xylose repressor n=1 Tax=Deinococcus malanensis TaxID=1706855 RepID=A0ABQ2EVA7_9DEIO|nr:ROK family transcriptional regulator [Deinococcus malanensis]GGK26320.1 xylose repressor [Deinococcus malanensis]
MATTFKEYRAGDLGFLKQLNRAAVIDVIRHEPGVSRSEIAARAGLTKPTVSAVVQELLDHGWLAEGELQQGGGGRPGRALHLNEHTHALIGAEVGVHGLRAVACTLNGTIIHALSSTSAPGTPAATSEQLANLITQLLRAPQVTGRSLLGLGVAVPGPVAFTEARVLSAPNLGWRDVPFLDLLRPHLHDLDGPWLLENEAKAAAFGEFFFHKYNAPDSLAYISLGTGIGSGFIQSGSPPSILRGAHGLASEIGHTVLQPGGPYCHCGNRGCAETLTSSWSIRAALNISEDLPLADALVPRLNEPAVHLTLKRAGEALGMLLLNVHHTFNPAKIVIGGSLTRLGEPLLQPALDYFGTHHNRLLSAQREVPIRVIPDSLFLPARGAAAQVLANVVHTTGAIQ